MAKSSSSTEKTNKTNTNTRKPKTAKNPTYRQMILDALLQLQVTNKGGSSVSAIAKFIENKYSVVPSFRSRLQLCVKKGVTEGWLVQVRRSFKISSATKNSLLKPKKPVDKSGGGVSRDEEEEEEEDEDDEDELDLEGTESEVEYRRKVRRRVKRRLSFDPQDLQQE